MASLPPPPPLLPTYPALNGADGRAPSEAWAEALRASEASYRRTCEPLLTRIVSYLALVRPPRKDVPRAILAAVSGTAPPPPEPLHAARLGVDGKDEEAAAYIASVQPILSQIASALALRAPATEADARAVVERIVGDLPKA
jgi:hypothetical protein